MPASLDDRFQRRVQRRRRAFTVAAGLSIALALGACTLDIQNLHAKQELEARAKPPGSLYLGWRVFQARCASCHGDAAQIATGVPGAPDLLERMRGLGPRAFVDVVVRRYEWALPGGSRGETLLDDIVQRRVGQISMPDWQGEPAVEAHLLDLHAYLAARAEGTQGPGRPER